MIVRIDIMSITSWLLYVTLIYNIFITTHVIVRVDMGTVVTGMVEHE